MLELFRGRGSDEDCFQILTHGRNAAPQVYWDSTGQVTSSHFSLCHADCAECLQKCEQWGDPYCSA